MLDSWFRQYFTFNGRISRLSFWLRQLLFWPLLYVFLVLVSLVFGTHLKSNFIAEDISLTGDIIISVVVLIILWSATCAGIQRWHDRNRSGWWYWVGLIPLIGNFYALGECGFRRGTIGPNRFGPDPLARG